MNTSKGYYSLIQFCPDASRLETVNVGVLLFCPGKNFIKAKTATGNQRPKKLVGNHGLNIHSLNNSKQALVQRVETEKETIQTLDDLNCFVNTRANLLKLTPPRPIKVFEPERDLETLFSELVGGTSTRTKRKVETPQLDKLFERLKTEGRAKLDLSIPIPLMNRNLHIPYAYQNGVLNLIKPKQFSSDENNARKSACELAVEGDLIRRHDSQEQKRLVIISLFDENAEPTCQELVGDILKEYEIGSISKTEIPEFIEKVEAEAHP